jgi:hypothetical protein
MSSRSSPFAAALRARLEATDARLVAVLLAVLGVAVYFSSNPERTSAGFYDHFVWQADAFLHGRVAIRYPVETGPFRNDYFQDVFPVEGRPGFALIPFPPLPALLLLPAVAVFGLTTNAGALAVLLGGVNVGLAWLAARRLTRDPLVALTAALFFGFGTVAWYAAMLGSTWFLAHVVATTFLFVAIMLALDGERAGDRAPQAHPRGVRGLFALIDRRQFLTGLVFGVAGLARLTTIFAAPFFVFVGSGGSFFRRALSAGLGAVIPVLLLLAYNLSAAGSLFHPAYQHLYETEGVPRGTGALTTLIPGIGDIQYRHGEWGIEDPRYLPQNLPIMLAWLPEVHPECGLSLLATDCTPDDPDDQPSAFLRPDRLGMSIFLTSPAYLLAVPLLRAEGRRRLVLGAALAVASVALINLMHFSQGWVQFGYRFSNDFAPFALVLVTLALARSGLTKVSVALVAASIAVNAWGVHWGVALGW